ncbi:uncharacterized protein LOC128231467 isoform X1 [Mya arenaria]|uniref:uncharacterized protein LOC128231467 isoform X1 n=1 Tax=Mya arenaria TaxID=6604 RepID=UPI0022E30E9B|nr:uncharacterized protein LOC128231467 isoform X1 [Mya arenaria]
MQCTVFRSFFTILCGFSIGFQLVGIIAPAWTRWAMSIHTGDTDMDLSINMGFIITKVCVRPDGMADSTCVTTSSGNLFDQMSLQGTQTTDWQQMAQQNFASSFTILKILVLAGGILALVGFLLVLMHFRREDNNVPGRAMAILGTIAWALCGLLVFAAVAIQGFRHANTVSGLEMLESMDAFEGISIELYFPWGILVSGIGASLALMATLAVSVRLCRSNSSDQYGGGDYSAHYTPASKA